MNLTWNVEKRRSPNGFGTVNKVPNAYLFLVEQHCRMFRIKATYRPILHKEGYLSNFTEGWGIGSRIYLVDIENWFSREDLVLK